MALPGSRESEENDFGWEVVENIEVDEPRSTAKNTIYRWVDTEAGVVLYYFTGVDKGGLTAIPLSDTELETDEKPKSEDDGTGADPEAVIDSASITETMEQVEEGDRIVWNGRTTPQPVTDVANSYFEAEGNRGGRYRFFTRGTDAPYLRNLNSGREYDVDEFEIVHRY